jgi:Antibiotic biosynthesis monooxygenase
VCYIAGNFARVWKRSSIAAWERATQLIMQHRGGLGSRLHKAEDGTWYAYAQWPTKEAWQAHRAAGSVDPEVTDLMLEAEEMELPPVCLTPVADFLLCSNCGQKIWRTEKT